MFQKMHYFGVADSLASKAESLFVKSLMLARISANEDESPCWLDDKAAKEHVLNLMKLLIQYKINVN